MQGNDRSEWNGGPGSGPHSSHWIELLPSDSRTDPTSETRPREWRSVLDPLTWYVWVGMTAALRDGPRQMPDHVSVRQVLTRLAGHGLACQRSERHWQVRAACPRLLSERRDKLSARAHYERLADEARRAAGVAHLVVESRRPRVAS